MLTHLLLDEGFFKDTVSTIHLSDFDLPACKLIYEVAKAYYTKYEKLPHFSTLELEVQRAVLQYDGTYETAIQPEEYESLGGVMAMLARATPATLDVAYFRDDLRKYLLYIRTAAIDAQDLPPDQRIAAYQKLDNDVNKIGTASEFNFSFGTDPISDNSGLYQDRIATGIYKLDRKTGGGLCRKQTGLLVACTGVGKTTGMINFACSNALNGIYSLFITLELPEDFIKQRYHSILAHVDAHKLGDKSQWTSDMIERLKYTTSPEFRLRKYMTALDLSVKSVALNTIERAIAGWKDGMVRAGYPADKVAVVYIDWLEKILKEGLPGVKYNTNDATAYKVMLEQIGEIARRYDVLIWTATQATREAEGREYLERKHTANSVHAHDSVDLSVGIAPMGLKRDDTGNVTYDEDNDDYEFPACDRVLNGTLMKVRYGASTGHRITFYQGPTLRFWIDKSNAEAATTTARGGNMELFYNQLTTAMRKK